MGTSARWDRKVKLHLPALQALAKNWTAEEIAELCDPPLSRSHVANMLAGRSNAQNPSIDTVTRIAEALNVPVEAIVVDPDDLA